MHGEKCADAIRLALAGMGDLELDSTKGRVVLRTLEPWSIALERIERTGRKAVLVGFGGQSAVSIITPSGNLLDRSSVQGVVRYSSIRNDDQPGLVVDGVVDGLKPGKHSLHIHEAGDTSAGCASLGERYWPEESSGEFNPSVGSIEADDNGRATFRYIDPTFRMSDIIGRSVVIKSPAHHQTNNSPNNCDKRYLLYSSQKGRVEIY